MPCTTLPSIVPCTAPTEGKPRIRPSYRILSERGESSWATEAPSTDPTVADPSSAAKRPFVPLREGIPTEGPTDPPSHREETLVPPHSPPHETPIPSILGEPLRVPKNEPRWIPISRRYTPSHPPPFDPDSFENKRYIHDRIHRNLIEYKQWDQLKSQGFVSETDIAPSYYSGRDQFPGGIFEEVGVDPATWGPDFGATYGGAGGQFLPQGWYGGPGGPLEEQEDDGMNRELLALRVVIGRELPTT